ncbi:MAG: glycyl-radical enzyme activating protein [Lactobacillales bacterium]|jgi:pyruvate formate lyase activating enzyme|nr:glycyl-radical enzyme activating protein [Lactobacillales bacterium]
MVDKACIFNIQHFSIHDGPGIRSVVFFKGCPLRCYWCANPESQSPKPEQMYDNLTKRPETVGEYKTVEEIMDEVMKDEDFYLESDGGVTLSGGEPLFQAEFATQLLKELKKKNIHTACETTGYVASDVFEKVIDLLDSLYLDIKHYDTLQHKNGIGVRNEQILKNLKLALKKKTNLTVRIPIIPNYNSSLEDAQEFVRLFQQVGVSTIEILPFHQFGEKKYEYLDRPYELKNAPQLHSEDLLEYQQIFENAGIHCLVR